MEKPDRINMLLQMLEQEPNDLFLNYALGIELLSKGSSEEAILQFQKVIGLNSDHIPSYYQLGKAYEGIGKIEIALNNYRIGLEKAKSKKDHKSINEFGEAIFMLED